MPAHVVIYYVIALSLYMQSSCREVLRCLLEGVQWLAGPLSTIKVTGRAGISQARKRMGSEPLKQLHDAIVRPLATTRTQEPGIGMAARQSGCSTLDVADTAANTAAFGKASGPRGPAGYSPDPLCLLDRERNSCLVSPPGWTATPHRNMRWRKQVIPGLSAGMLCLADRLFAGYSLWSQSRSNRCGPALARGQNISPGGGQKTARRVLPQ